MICHQVDSSLSLLQAYNSPSPVSQPVGKQVVTLVPGDGVWPELMNSVKEVIRQAQVPIVFEEKLIRYVW